MPWIDPDGFRGCGFFQVRDGLIHHQRGYWDSAQLRDAHPDVHAWRGVSQSEGSAGYPPLRRIFHRTKLK